MSRVRIAGRDDLEDGQMKQVEVEGRAVLLVRNGDTYQAFAGSCPHHGAPLAEGLLHQGRVLCPWHQAIFDALTGELREPPALDDLPRFPLSVEGEQLVLELPDQAEATQLPRLARPQQQDSRRFLILGAGAAGLAAAQELRHAGFRGTLLLVSHEDRLPYDRTACSKDFLAGETTAEQLPLRDEGFYSHYGIERITRRIARLDLTNRTAWFDDGNKLQADKLLVATGSKPRTLDLPGAQLPGVRTLRTWEDAERIVRRAESARAAVVVGASFIAMEVAASLRQRDLAVTVVAPEEQPMQGVFGEAVGQALRSLHEQHGVSFRLGSKPAAFRGEEQVQEVELEGGERLPADLVVIGVGVQPALEFVQGVTLTEDGGLATDAQLRVAEGVYAAGDVASFPDFRTGKRIRVEHWRLALQHGRCAARNMAGHPEEFAQVPFFWTIQYGTSLSYVGFTKSWDELIVQGRPQDFDFIAYFVKDGQVLAAAGAGRDKSLGAVHELMLARRPLDPAALRQGQDPLELIE